MNAENRPNIITVGALAGALSWFVCFGLKTGLEIDLGAEGGVALSTVVTYGLQWADRFSKRSSRHVINKHGNE